MPDAGPIHTIIDVPPDEDVEIVRDDCPCPPGEVCPDDGLFAQACPRRPYDDAALAEINQEDDAS